jgi:Fibronectin type III-like domain
LRIALDITNTGTRRGCQVVQAYVAPSASRLTRPPKELKAFAKVWLDPGETTTVELAFDNRAFAYFDPAERDFAEILTKQRTMNAFAPSANDVRTTPGWYVDAGEYRIAIGTSSTQIDHQLTVEAPSEIQVPI